MSTEGTEVFQELNACLARARRDLADCQAESDRLDAQMRDLVSKRGEALLKLARHYLPEVSRPAIESTFEGIRSDLMAILAEQEAKRSELRGRIGRDQEEVRSRNAEIQGVTGRLNAKVAERDRLEAQVAEILKGNADFQERSKLALQAEERLHRDERRVEEMTKEAAEKLPHYDGSRLFRYLHDRGFGTPEYKVTGLALNLDRWVAALIDFPNARNGYEFLKKAPGLVAAEVARRRDQFSELMGQVEAIEKAEADKIGLTRVLGEGDALGTERDRLVGEVERLQAEAQALQQELAGLDRDQGRFYTRAIDRFRTFLGETRLAMLERRARQTPEPEDDAIVAELGRLDEQIDGIGPRLDALARRRQEADRVQEGLDQVIRRYRMANYDSDRSYFEDFDVRAEAARFEDGSVDAEGLWRAIQSAQKFRPNWVESTAQNGIQVATSPTGRVILGAIVDIAGAAMQANAYRGVRRRSDASFPSFPSSDGGFQAPSMPDPPSVPSEGGFTTGEGF